MSLTTKVAIPAGINPGISSAKQATMLSLLGSPRKNFDEHCRPVEQNTKLAQLIKTDHVGPFRATGLIPAIDSLKLVFANVKTANRPLYDAVGNAGMFCARLVRGSSHSISNHSWATAIDLLIEGNLDARGDGMVYKGLVDIAPFFNTEGWFWGAGFRTEDAMHFEVSDQKMRQWATTGKLDPTGAGIVMGNPVEILSLGDRGPDVKKLQEALNTKGGFDLKPDGAFGRATLAAVMAFQADNGLAVDGAVGRATQDKL